MSIHPEDHGCLLQLTKQSSDRLSIPDLRYSGLRQQDSETTEEEVQNDEVFSFEDSQDKIISNIAIEVSAVETSDTEGNTNKEPLKNLLIKTITTRAEVIEAN